jgi:hypothetical protein
VVEGKLKIGVIVGIAFVAGIIGTLSFASFDTQIQSEPIQTQAEPGNAQALAIGANVIIKAYHEDGTLYHEWEDHNVLVAPGKARLVGCVTGLILTPSQCNFMADDLQLTVRNQSNINEFTSFVIPGEITPKGNNCNTPINAPISQCDGWEILGTFDFAGLECTDGVDCYNATRVRSGNGTAGNPTNMFNFNEFNNFGLPGIAPNDRFFVNMTFTIPS